MEYQKRKLQQRIARPMEKVQRLIREQDVRLAALDSVAFLRKQDYLQALSLARNKLFRLKQELRVIADIETLPS